MATETTVTCSARLRVMSKDLARSLDGKDDVKGVVDAQDNQPVKHKDDYALKRDCNANSRLTAQHYLWKDLVGCNIHPSIPTDGEGLKIADVATGNGIWLQDVARQCPNASELHGFDISLHQVGHPQWLPSKIKMHTWDVLDAPPAEFVGYFDVVHVRLITMVVRNDDPTQILQNLWSLLKPNGYLQWSEVDTIGCSIDTVPGHKAPKLDALFSQLKGTDTWKANFAELMTAHNFGESRLHVYKHGYEVSRLWTDLYISTWKEFAQQVLKTPEVSEKLEREAMVEVRAGAAIMVPILIWVGRKL